MSSGVNQPEDRTREAADVAVPVTKQPGGVASHSAPSMPMHEGQSDMDVDLSQFEDMDAEGQSEPDWHYQEVFQHGGDISDVLTDSQIAALAQTVLREYQVDEDSRTEAVNEYDKAMARARAESKPKNHPFQNAANTKYPLLSVASLQFAARAYPAIVKGSDVVKARVNGKDDEQGTKAARAERISEHMSFQLTEEQTEWESQIDTLLHHLPLAGTAFRCVYYSEELGRNTSELVNMRDFVINNDAESMADAPRFTRIRRYYPFDIKKKMRSGFYRKDDAILDDTDDDSQKLQVIYEQHRLEDLDGDGVDEPYVVTVHKNSGKVLRVVPSADVDKIVFDEDDDGVFLRDAAHEPLYVRYVFMPDPEGKMYGMGFGKLLESVGESIDTVLNQILDAAHLQNAGGGYLGGNVDFGKRREVRTKPGEWRVLKSNGMDIRQAIVPHQWQGPSSVLFQVLGLLVDMGKEIGSIKDVLSGESSGANMPVGTTMALIEQGLQQFTAIYKRIYRSLREEYRLLYRLNSLHLQDEQYFNVMDSEKAVARADYAQGDYDVSPISDPSAVTTMQRMSKVEFALQLKGQPHINDEAVDRRAMMAANIEDIDELINKPDEAAQQQQMQLAQIEMARLEAEVKDLQAKAALAQSKAVEAMASAEAKDDDIEIKEGRLVLDSMIAGKDVAGFESEGGDDFAPRPDDQQEFLPG